MAVVGKHPVARLLFLAVLLAVLLMKDATGTRVRIAPPHSRRRADISSLTNVKVRQEDRDIHEILAVDGPKRLLIGSVAPTCTYNECRGCKYKCRAEQVPVEGNDPINSAYHYKCVCHR